MRRGRKAQRRHAPAGTRRRNAGNSTRFHAAGRFAAPLQRKTHVSFAAGTGQIGSIGKQENVAGGPAILASSGANTAYGVIELTPGDWLVAGSQFMQPPVQMTVTGDMPSDLAESETTATIELTEMSITVTDVSLVVGQNTVKIYNVGDQPHFVEIAAMPDGVTEEQVAATLGVFMGTPAPADMQTLEDVELVSIAVSTAQWSGTTQWVSWDLQPGTYVAMGWFPDRETGMPHAFMGMWKLFTIE